MNDNPYAAIAEEAAANPYAQFTDDAPAGVEPRRRSMLERVHTGMESPWTEGGPLGLDESRHPVLQTPILGPVLRNVIQPPAALLDATGRAFMSGVRGIGGVAAGAYDYATGDTAMADRLERDISTMGGLVPAAAAMPQAIALPSLPRPFSPPNFTVELNRPPSAFLAPPEGPIAPPPGPPPPAPPTVGPTLPPPAPPGTGGPGLGARPVAPAAPPPAAPVAPSVPPVMAPTLSMTPLEVQLQQAAAQLSGADLAAWKQQMARVLTEQGYPPPPGWGEVAAPPVAPVPAPPTGPIRATPRPDMVRSTPSVPPGPSPAGAGAEAPPATDAPPPASANTGEQAAAGPAAAPIPPPVMAPAPMPWDPAPSVAVQQLADMLDDPRSADEIAAAGDAASPADPPPIPQPPPARPPLRPQSAEHVAAAAAQTAEPTPAQAQAGNYRKGRLNIDGLNISIETPQGGTRSGTGPNGEKWSVDMPADYGYIRRTEGADGDHLDAYLGPQAHEAQKHPVFVIDQRDADGGAFDEHKIMLGFPTRQAAIDAYTAAFSDGKGRARIGAVTAMPWGSFKAWVRDGDHARPVQYSRPKPPREKGQRRPISLTEFLASRGGLADHGDLRAMDAHRKFIPRYGRLVRRTGGMPLDRAREVAEEAGFLGMNPQDYGQSTTRDLLEAIDRDLRGQHVFSSLEAGNIQAAETRRREEADEDRRESAEAEIRAAAKDAGVQGLRQYEVDDAVRFMLTEGWSPHEALTNSLERHAERWLEEYREIEHDAGNDIPFDFTETPDGILPVPAIHDGQDDALGGEPGAGPVASDAAGRPPAGDRPGNAGQGGQGAERGEGRPDGGQPTQPRPGAGAAAEGGRDGGVAQPATGWIDLLRASEPEYRRLLVEAVQSRVREGRRVNIPTATRVTVLSKHAHAAAIRFRPGGEFGWVEMRAGQRWDAIIGGTLDAVARQVGFPTSTDRWNAQHPDEGAQPGDTAPPRTEKVDTLDGARDQGLLDGVAEPLPGVRGRPEKQPAAPAEPGGMFSAGAKQTDLTERIRDEDAAKFGNLAAPNMEALARAFADEFRGGRKFSSIVQARQFAASKLGGAVQPGTTAAKAVDEAVELGVVLLAREIAASQGSDAEKFDRLRGLYDQQPTLGTRTSDSIERQAYSTPVPLAFVASRLADISGRTSVYEPTAGNGALLIEAAPGRTMANELDAERQAALRAQGFTVTGNDASKPSAATEQDRHGYDRIIANPPFGALRGVDGETVRHDMGFVQRGYTTGEIDHAIALRALEGMKDDGRAVLILGGLNKLTTGDEARAAGYNGKAKREFFYTLYQRYGVVDHFTVPGDLYAKQGAGWPVDVIVIDGRRKSDRPLPSVSAPRVIGSWDDLKGMLDASNPALASAGPAPSMDAPRPEPERGGGAAGSGGSAPTADAGPILGAADRPAGVDAGTGRRPAGERGADGERDGGSGVLDGGNPVPDAPRGSGGAGAAEPVVPARADAAEPAGRPGAVDGAEPAPSARGDRGDQPDRLAGSAAAGGREPQLTARERREQRQAKAKAAAEEGSGTQAPYEPASRQRSVETLVPTNMRTAVHEALERQAEATGGIDAFVAEKLGYPVADLGKYFSAEQVDALALAIRQIDSGAGFVIGDQTGVGKGRFVAGLIRYAERSGLTPVFVTEKPNLYADMARDLTAIGMPEMVDAIFATNSALRLQLTDDPDGPKLRTADAKAHEKAIEAAASARKLPQGKRVLFTTYSQMQRVKGTGTQRMRLMTALAPSSFLILDEAHNAGGAGVHSDPDGATRASFVRGIVSKARSVAYSSATWAKRPDVLDLYGAKTDMRFAVPELSKLADAIAKGGVPMQQIVTAQLAEVGQYTRREKSFKGVSYQLKPVETDREAYDQVADVLARIFRISEHFVKPAVREIAKDIRAEAKAISGDGATGGAGASSTSFGAVMHNLINQLLLASKADATVERTLAALKDGKKPVIALANTMGSFIAEYAEMVGAKPGDPLDLNFNTLLKRYLQRTLRYVEKKPFSKERGEVRWLKPEHLGMEGEDLFHETADLIDSLKLDAFPVVPIDYIRAKIEAAGYKVGEVTGRTEAASYKDDGRVLYRQRPATELSPNGRQSAIRAFNSGALDVMILNQSGATGLSLHASETFKDKRQRKMLLAQAEANIDTHMQMLGRVHRTGQVIPPEYEQLFANVPAENRPAAVLAKKMASLNASTTANRTSDFTSSDTPDVMNVYGGAVIAQMLAEDRDLDLALGEPGEGGGRGEDEGGAGGVDLEALARKVTGRLPLLPLDRQEAVWNEIIDRYNRTVQAADEAGENVLEAKTFDLDAKVVEEHQMEDATPPPAGQENNPFAAPAKLVEMDVRRLINPPSSARIVAETMAGLGLGTVEEVEKQFADAPDEEVAQKLASNEVDRASLARQAEHEAVIRQATAARMATIDKQYSDPAKADLARKVALDIGGRIKDILAATQPGTLVSLRKGSDLGDAGSPVLVLSSRLRGDRALAPSSWDVVVVDAEGRRRVLPLSAFKTSDDAGDTGYIVEAVDGLTERGFLEGLAAGAGEARERRAMVTGNILKGYAALGGKGQIINFLDHDGELRQGILLPRTFEIDGYLASRAPSLTPERAIEVLNARGHDTPPFVTSNNATFTISATDKGGFAVSVPESKARGGAFYLSPAVRNAIGKPFVSRGGKMVAQVSADRMPDLIYAMAGVMRGQGGHFTSSHQAAAKYAPPKKAPPAKMAVGWDAAESGPEQQANPEAIAAALQAVRAIVGPQAAVQLRGGLRDPMGRAGDVGGVTIGPLIRVAVGPRAPWNIHHEAVHALRNLGVLTPREWRTLEDAAKRQGWLGEFEILKRYAYLAAEGQIEEAVAEKFAQWSTGRTTPQGGPLRRAWGRVSATVDRMRNALAGRGFQTADDVFGRIARGEVGARPAGSRAPRRNHVSVDEAIRAAAFFDTFADVPSNVQAVLAEAARFAINPSPQGRMSTAQPVTFAAPQEPRTTVGKAIDAAIHGLQDKHKDTADTLAAIRKAGRVVDDDADPRLAEELFHHRVTKRMKDFARHELEPLMQAMAERKVGLAEFEQFLHARHAEERNQQIARINPAMPDGGSGMDTAAAQAHLASMPAAKRRDLDALAGYVDGITGGTRALLARYELEDQATLRAWTDAYQHYVPLMREEMQSAGPETGVGFSTRGPASRRAMGSERPVADIIANVAMQRERAIIRGEKNRVANALLQLARDHPNPDFWKIDEPPTKRFIDPQTGLVRSMVDPTYKGHDNVVVARQINNRNQVVEHALIFDKANPRALRMAMAYRNLDVDQLPWLWGTVMGTPTRLLAKLSTQWNPFFGVVNVIRDVQEALVNLSSTPIRGRRAQMLRNMPMALWAVYRSSRRERAGQSPTPASLSAGQRAWRDLWEEFQQVGGPTGFRDLFETAQERTSGLEDDLRRLLAGKGRGPLRAVADWLSDYNEALENATRLSVYKAGKDAGLSRQRAASVAKNITVNFNRKGAQTNQLGAVFAFFNAATQGIARNIQTFRSPAGKAIIAGGMMLGAVQQLALMAAGFDENEIPDFVKERNWIIPTGVGKGYATIPMPLGYQILPNIGRVTMELALSGGEEAAAKMGKLTRATADAFNPLGSSQGGFTSLITPTALDPLVAMETNTAWTGRPVSLTPRGQNDPTPGFQRPMRSATWLGTEVARWINLATGGTDYTRGWLSPTPDQLEYLARQYTGGIGGEAVKAYRTGAAIARGEAPELKDIPLVSRFAGAASSRSATAAAYYEAIKRMREHEATVKGLARDGGDVAGYLRRYPEAELTVGAGYRVASPLNAVDRAISKLRREQRAIRNPADERAKEIDAQVQELMQSFNQRVKDAKGRTP